ncbi:YqzL family protein [Paenibacillus validus]|uniref:YqzL family protein n=1 Tax=Paenibacillus validus TaxID=44253 RepID=A0A7X2ZE28_9BACL|nr:MULTISPECIES: YqzL family protein [Paenibacillus]MED4602648.1 YqzL family protein [Paenibacillus validus]MED4608887.1 YqzL family protein [Paenibacillus validus]MUG72548.1 YqzL family protein [Paenibacillus validus]
MRDFSWKYFSMTGDVDAYLLYKEMNVQDGEEPEPEEEAGLEASDWLQ